MTFFHHGSKRYAILYATNIMVYYDTILNYMDYIYGSYTYLRRNRPVKGQ